MLIHMYYNRVKSTAENMTSTVPLLRQYQVADRSDMEEVEVGVDHRARRAHEVDAKFETTSMEVT